LFWQEGKVKNTCSKKKKAKTKTTTTKKQSKLCAFLFAVCVNFVLLYVFLISQFS